METLFYLPSSGQVYYADQLQQATGFSPDADPSYLAANGIYTVNQTANPCDPYLYSAEANYTVAGNYANQSWTCTAYPLSTAQQGAVFEEKVAANNATSEIIASNNVSTDVMTSVAGQLLVDRPAALQTILAEMEVVSDNLGANIAAIEAATTVDEINNIVNPPTGILHTGRGNFVLNQDLLQASYFVEFNSVSLTEADTELYSPATSTVVAYNSGTNQFPLTASFFADPDFRIQLRVAATGQVITEFEIPTIVLGGSDYTF